MVVNVNMQPSIRNTIDGIEIRYKEKLLVYEIQVE